ncbi:MAG: HAD hydrolase-like protein [Flavobacteriaceae bacterium]|nr:HAD hydrolase-like protein [Flavobacteriaceae bacterium]
MTYKNIKVIAFDADDTLWVNETYFREAELQFAKLLSKYETLNKIDQELFKIEMNNLPLYGYGIKGFILSMVESALKLSNYKLSPNIINEIIAIGKEMIDKPVELLDGVEQVLKTLKPKYKIILATKGDLLDQERKLEKSGLTKYFHHIEVLSEKKETNYKVLLSHLGIKPSEFLMVGNSLKSDVLPLLEIGAKAIHVPFHTTWAHEVVTNNGNNNEFRTAKKLNEILKYL